MRLQRIIMALAALLIGAMHLHAAVSHLTVELKSGSKYSFLLANKPVVTFKTGDLVINNNSETSYAIEGVKNFHFTESDETTPVDESSSKNESSFQGDIRIISLDDATIQIDHLAPLSDVKLVTVMGRLISSQSANSDGSAVVSLPQTQGIYILSLGTKSFKIIRK